MTYIYTMGIIFFAYLCGSIPVGYLVAKLYGVDVTQSGSGRIGGTNVLRAAGGGAAGLTVFGDVMKGLIPVFFLVIISPHISPYWVTALAASATVLGHNFSIFLGFRGGVGAGTAVGSFGGLYLWVGLLAAILAIIALAISRYASILSTTVAISGLLLLIICAFLQITPYEYILTGVLNSVIILNALRPNYARIRAGTERKVGTPKSN
ncbi:glycerol-3-phosphate acyltransferase [Anaerolineales bacterium HSG24]|nr:glycerol-3-phosphate acyltransferase [Anaerolineales bacterium HSG24]